MFCRAHGSIRTCSNARSVLNRRTFCGGLLSLWGQTACTQPGRRNLNMTPSATLTIKPRGQSARSFLPEQEAAFDIALRNTGSAPANLVSLSGNLDTPAIHL